jgi:hypothetical protein
MTADKHETPIGIDAAKIHVPVCVENSVKEHKIAMFEQLVGDLILGRDWSGATRRPILNDRDEATLTLDTDTLIVRLSGGRPHAHVTFKQGDWSTVRYDIPLPQEEGPMEDPYDSVTPLRIIMETAAMAVDLCRLTRLPVHGADEATRMCGEAAMIVSGLTDGIRTPSMYMAAAPFNPGYFLQPDQTRFDDIPDHLLEAVARRLPPVFTCRPQSLAAKVNISFETHLATTSHVDPLELMRLIGEWDIRDLETTRTPRIPA